MTFASDAKVIYTKVFLTHSTHALIFGATLDCVATGNIHMKTSQELK